LTIVPLWFKRHRKMKARWVDKNVDLEQLSRRLEQFFKDQGFETTIERCKAGCTISGHLRVGRQFRSFLVSITGSPKDLTVEFLAEKEGRLSLLAGPLITMFGGGVFMLDRLKRREFYEKLESGFWLFTEELVDYLAKKTDSSTMASSC
jgi:hypothetical protein